MMIVLLRSLLVPAIGCHRHRAIPQIDSLYDTAQERNWLGCILQWTRTKKRCRHPHGIAGKKSLARGGSQGTPGRGHHRASARRGMEGVCVCVSVCVRVRHVLCLFRYVYKTHTTLKITSNIPYILSKLCVTIEDFLRGEIAHSS